MSKIKILPLQEAQKIAAGEVVERPAHVVKELIENSLDANATQITIIIENGGKKLIRIIDNGLGMTSDDLPLAVTNHATSKAHSVDDLQTLQTFGFRGEGLASIAAVSKMTLISKEKEITQASRLVVHGGIIITHDELASTTGTDISVEDLFFNLPARQKFLKKKETEWRHITQLIHAFALSNLHVQFKLIADGDIIIQCKSAQTIEERANQLWHNDKQTPLYSLDYSIDSNNHSLGIRGVVTDHQLVRYDRSGLYFFVNKRLIQNYQLSNALLKGFQKLIPENRYPHAAVLIEYPHHLIDINIHPRKEEVRFAHPLVVTSAITQAVMSTFEKKSRRTIEDIKNVTIFPTTIAKDSYPAYSHTSFNVHTDDISTRFPSSFQKINPLTDSIQKPITVIHTALPVMKETNRPEIFDKISPIEQSLPQNTLSELYQKTFSYQILGNYDNTYILFQHTEGLLLIDQHAAHERILYERFKNNMHTVSTELLFPELISITPHELELLTPYLPLFEKQGVIIELFGENKLIVKATPVHEKKINYHELIKELLAIIHSEEEIDPEQLNKKIQHTLLAQMACKAAVKAGDSLSINEMEKLVEDLSKTSNQQSCPHGRPVSWLLPKIDIEKKFKRKL